MMSRRSMQTRMSLCSETCASPFQWEMRIPLGAMGLVIGKGGATIKSFCTIPGVSSINCSPNGTIQIYADSQKALDTVVGSIVQCVIFYFDRTNGYFPRATIFCLCKSVQDPLLSSNKVSFERFSNPIPNLFGGQYQPQRPHFCFSSGEISQEGKSGTLDNAESLTSQDFFCLQWDFSAYRSKLRARLEPLIFSRHETLRSMKLALRYGKLLFCCSELSEGVSLAVERLHDLWTRKILDNKFSAACSDSAFRDTNFLHRLETLGYHKASTRRKIIMQVTDLQNRWRVYNVSVRLEGLEQTVAVKKLRTERRRHAFVTFCREGSAATDFRLAITSYGSEMEPIPEMVNWIENAWSNRSPEGLLVFGPCSSRFMAVNIRYEEVDTYLSEHWKLRVAQGGDTDGRNPLSERWDCVSSSRWFKKNGHQIEGEEGMEFALANMEAFVKEGARLSCLMDVI